MHEQKKRRKYDSAFKAEVLRMVDNGQSVPYTAEALGISENLIYSWKKKNKMGKEKSASQSELSIENQQLRNQVRQLETERDILKKALSIFSRGS
ncbi:MAG: transposase [Bacteroidetes bacterium]|nr:transposase [Bacteroidota bacterium]